MWALLLYLDSLESLSLDSMATILDHPFYPLNLNVVGYAANTMSIPALLGVFAIATIGIIVFSSSVLKMIKPSISRTDKILVGWFIFSGFNITSATMSVYEALLTHFLRWMHTLYSGRVLCV